MSETDTRLWCLHNIGPDDVHPAPDFETAQRWANWANATFAEHAPISRFVVAIWPWSASRHADGLEASIAGWTLPNVKETPVIEAMRADMANFLRETEPKSPTLEAVIHLIETGKMDGDPLMKLLKRTRHDERKRLIAQGCIHTRKAGEHADYDRPDLSAWQTEQSEWFDPTILEIVSEYAVWRDRRQSQAAADVVAERQRQIDREGYSPEHDDEHSACELAGAAACYAILQIPHWAKQQILEALWPPGWGQMSIANDRRNLVKAGALIVAEIERLDRAAVAKATV